MKSINAAVMPGSWNTYYLGVRRESSVNTATLKREERRKQRHNLQAEMSSLISACKNEETFVAQATSIPQKNVVLLEKAWLVNVPRKVSKMFTVPAGYNPATPKIPQATVVVTRKRAFHKATVETLQMFA